VKDKEDDENDQDLRSTDLYKNGLDNWRIGSWKIFDAQHVSESRNGYQTYTNNNWSRFDDKSSQSS